MSDAQPSISLDDLQTVLQIIQVVTSRGAIKPDEMAIVGSVYDRISKFIAANSAQQAQAQAPQVGDNKGE